MGGAGNRIGLTFVLLRFAVAAWLTTACLAARAQNAASIPQPSGTSSAWNSLVDDYFDQGYFRMQPVLATFDGFHKYDSLVEDNSREGITRKGAILREYEKRFLTVDAAKLDPIEAADREILLANIRGRLLTLETIRPWQKDPDSYSSGVAMGIYFIMERNFAPANVRLASAIAREKQIPGVLAQARENLQNPPQIYTEIALEQLPGLIGMFQESVPVAFSGVTDPKLKAEFAKTNVVAVAALKDYQNWLKTGLLPRSHGDFRIGAGTYRKKLLYDEMVDIPLDRLLKVATADLHKNQADFARVAAQADPGKAPRDALQELRDDHPQPAQLLPAFRDTFNALISFINEKHILTVPVGPQPILEDTPPFMSATTTAAMDPPGPLETNAKDVFFYVTRPGPHDTAAQIKDRMEGFNRGTILSTSIHEAYPGHYVQFLWSHSAPSKTRRILWPQTTGEGWAHYCEQMMLDEGYGQPGAGAKDAHQAALLRLGQLQDALLRDARFVVGIQMHTGKMTFDQAVDFFVKEGYQTHEIGLVEAKRGTSDPTYLYYTLGKLEIMKLRADVQRKEGKSFSLQKFHDDFLRQGNAPIKIIRRVMLGDDSPAL